MGGEGSMSYANQSLKLNRSQLRGRKFKDMKDLMRSYSGKTGLKFKEIAPEELQRIKAEIRKKARRERLKLTIALILSALITILIVLMVFQYA